MESAGNTFAKMVGVNPAASRGESPLVDIPLPPTTPNAGQLEIERASVEIFLISLPWYECPRCMARFKEEGSTMFDTDTVFRCPHHEKKEYEALLNKLLDRSKYFVYERRIETLKNGAIQVHIEWGELRTVKQKEGTGIKPKRL